LLQSAEHDVAVHGLTVCEPNGANLPVVAQERHRLLLDDVDLGESSVLRLVVRDVLLLDHRDPGVQAAGDRLGGCPTLSAQPSFATFDSPHSGDSVQVHVRRTSVSMKGANAPASIAATTSRSAFGTTRRVGRFRLPLSRVVA
jgi:hypothetical protein